MKNLSDTPESAHIQVIYSDEEGISHFRDEFVTLENLPFAPPAPPMQVSAPITAERCLFVAAPERWSGDWHPTPVLQVALILEGHFEVTVGDGETRTFTPGSIVRVEDTTGQGHRTRVTSESRGLMAMVQLGEHSG